MDVCFVGLFNIVCRLAVDVYWGRRTGNHLGVLLVEDKPAGAKWLSQNEKDLLQQALQKEQEGIKPVKDFKTAIKSRTVILLCLQYALWSIGVYGFVIWLPTIVKAAPGVDMVTTGWLSAVPYLMAVAGMLAVSYFSDKTQQRKIFIWPCLLIGSIAFYCSYLIGPHHFGGSFILLCIAGMAMYAPYGPFFALISETLPINVAAGATALINSFGALGSFAGAYLVGWLNGTTGGFSASYLFMAGALFLSAVLIIVAVRNGGILVRQKMLES